MYLKAKHKIKETIFTQHQQKGGNDSLPVSGHLGGEEPTVKPT